LKLRYYVDKEQYTVYTLLTWEQTPTDCKLRHVILLLPW